MISQQFGKVNNKKLHKKESVKNSAIKPMGIYVNDLFFLGLYKCRNYSSHLKMFCDVFCIMLGDIPYVTYWFNQLSLPPTTHQITSLFHQLAFSKVSVMLTLKGKEYTANVGSCVSERSPSVTQGFTG